MTISKKNITDLKEYKKKIEREAWITSVVWIVIVLLLAVFMFGGISKSTQAANISPYQLISIASEYTAKTSYCIANPSYLEMMSEIKKAEQLKEKKEKAYQEALEREKKAREYEEYLNSFVNKGTFKLTYYCPCAKCNGNTRGITASGARLQPGVSIAVDRRVIPLGSKVLIDGKEYIAHDTGGAIKGNRIDVCVSSHAEALRLGRTTATVYVKK